MPRGLLLRPRSPKHEQLYVDAAERRERHQERLARHMALRQRLEAEEQLRWKGERLAWQQSYRGPMEFRAKSHAERESELIQKRRRGHAWGFGEPGRAGKRGVKSSGSAVAFGAVAQGKCSESGRISSPLQGF